MAKLFTAKEVNEGIQRRWQEDLKMLKAKNVIPTLATVRIGENGADISYEKGASKKLTSLELGVRNIHLPAEVSERETIETLESLSLDPQVHGILLFQPLPEHFNDERVKAAINPAKDVDCATVENLAAVLAGWEDCYPYCAPQAVIETLEHYGIDVKNKYVVIVGSGLVVGKPLAMMLVNRWATVSLCNVYTKDTAGITRQADIVVSATGVAGLISKDYVGKGQIVIDVGTTYKEGKLWGDVNLDEVEPIVAAVTPTPGGISGITTTVLAKHLIRAARKQTEA